MCPGTTCSCSWVLSQTFPNTQIATDSVISHHGWHSCWWRLCSFVEVSAVQVYFCLGLEWSMVTPWEKRRIPLGKMPRVSAGALLLRHVTVWNLLFFLFNFPRITLWIVHYPTSDENVPMSIGKVYSQMCFSHFIYITTTNVNTILD